MLIIKIVTSSLRNYKNSYCFIKIYTFEDKFKKYSKTLTLTLALTLALTLTI